MNIFEKRFIDSLKIAEQNQQQYFLITLPRDHYTISYLYEDKARIVEIYQQGNITSLCLCIMANANADLNVMVDFETLSLQPNAFLLECGLVIFDNQFNIVTEALFTTNNLNYSASQDVDGNTLEWWVNQQDGLYNLLQRAKTQFNPNDLTVQARTCMLLSKLKQACPTLKFWSKGSFDADILRYYDNDIFKYNEFMDVRTIKTFAEMQGIVFDDKTKATHNALEDCRAQLEILKQANYK